MATSQRMTLTTMGYKLYKSFPFLMLTTVILQFDLVVELPGGAGSEDRLSAPPGGERGLLGRPRGRAHPGSRGSAPLGRGSPRSPAAVSPRSPARAPAPLGPVSPQPLQGPAASPFISGDRSPLPSLPSLATGSAARL
ncbi:unnamed protein product [Rangifer tarandus platyrhynchus]|uniref:Uncharacterized protein n=3 Tax=Rangifer tarandus platyrhynchus TaxID=3082113 RepID=A0ABN8YY14_RANTA|nr:unnamed protein product [Rangifer tarandus platyrhynchus]CAI9702369.1 unnamed protein product [Rangifer tarandus platyrhynchus]